MLRLPLQTQYGNLHILYVLLATTYPFPDELNALKVLKMNHMEVIKVFSVQ